MSVYVIFYSFETKNIYENDLIYSGAINLTSSIKAKVIKKYKDSTDKLIKLYRKE